MVGQSLTVLTVYWEGRFREREYTRDWVRKFRRMVGEALPHAEFRCLTNVGIEGVETIPLKHEYPGWWSKVELFRPDLPVEGRLLYLDLDTLIVGDLTELTLFESTPAFMPPSYKIHSTQEVGGEDVVNVYNSSVIVWNKGQGTELYEHFDSIKMNSLRGDQDWFGYISPHYSTLPTKWFSKLRYCKKGPPGECKIILCMPWKNETAANRFDWVNEIWNR